MWVNSRCFDSRGFAKALVASEGHLRDAVSVADCEGVGMRGTERRRGTDG